MKILLAFLLAFAVGAACRWFDVPVPAPPKLLGALLIITTTIGYMASDSYLTRRARRTDAVAESVKK
ncbi:MAG: DUF1427 family protein [Pyrinomonadaceae bacterium MAG19_C2-C3]|nr:DUF1427 family protein [Pyrinomonadaceae bacterium MAG19_C2-C3]